MGLEACSIMSCSNLVKQLVQNASCQLYWLNEEIQKKRAWTGEGNQKVILFHDNTWPHVASATDILLEIEWEVLSHLTYSPNFAPSDFYLF